MPPKFTIPSYRIFLASGLIHTAVAVTGLLALRVPALTRPLLGDVSVQEILLPALGASKAGELALEMMLTGMLCFAGLPALLVYFYNPTDRKSVLPLALPAAMYHMYHLLMLFSTFLTNEIPVLGPSETAVPTILITILNEAIKTYRVRLWFCNAFVHLPMYLWYVVWIVRVQETGGVPGYRLVNSKSKKE
ncbi:hypothetical protein CcCBS67573_g02671 [Chytriomyces confervae]|uniref:EXPERA domain-containing protein n=1 Tax=Chytriomyces confervae TaxID=246404 RepID=A0A507FID6_9FUNG|nr:hypothetical protein HDU80_007598 [Chytriomyces hyalinus]TPX76063.1 hypothetical protein CcCBS67573_g02671 [Chytriomyces confervae]